MISYFLVQLFDLVTRDDIFLPDSVRFLLELTNHILRCRNELFWVCSHWSRQLTEQKMRNRHDLTDPLCLCYLLRQALFGFRRPPVVRHQCSGRSLYWTVLQGNIHLLGVLLEVLTLNVSVLSTDTEWQEKNTNCIRIQQKLFILMVLSIEQKEACGARWKVCSQRGGDLPADVRMADATSEVL